MAEILIKGMEMPKKDDIVIMTLDSTGKVNVFGRRLLSLLSPQAKIHGLRVAETEAVALPEHGRLGDLDKVATRMHNNAESCRKNGEYEKAEIWQNAEQEVRLQGTILEPSN